MLFALIRMANQNIRGRYFWGGDYLRTHEGDRPNLIADGSSLTGTNANIDIDELRAGTKK